VARAQGDAEAIARASGRCIDELDELTTDQAIRPVMYEAASTRMLRTEAAQAPTPVSPGEQTLTVTVHGRWRLRQAGASCPTR
jgi:uncharacterized protein YggE